MIYDSAVLSICLSYVFLEKSVSMSDEAIVIPRYSLHLTEHSTIENAISNY